ncbi:hypothetical protein D3C80_1028930 [compost metagenome]
MFVANSQDFGLCCIVQGTESHALDVGRYDFIFSVAVSFWIGSFLHCCVDFFNSYGFFKNSYKLSQRTSCNWNTLSCTIKFALQIRNNQTDSFSSTSSVRDDVLSSSAGTSEVAFSVWSIKSILVTCVSVDSSHQAFNDTELVVQDFCHWSQAVSCARCAGDNCFGTIKDVIVYVVNNSFHVACSWSRDNYFFSSAFKVFLSSFFSCEETCALQNDVYAKLSPRKFFRVAVSQNLNVFAVHFEESVMNFNFTLEFTLSCIIFKQMSKHLSVSQVVDCYHFDTFYILNTAECKASNTSKTVNTNFYTH